MLVVGLAADLFLLRLVVLIFLQRSGCPLVAESNSMPDIAVLRDSSVHAFMFLVRIVTKTILQAMTRLFFHSQYELHDTFTSVANVAKRSIHSRQDQESPHSSVQGFRRAPRIADKPKNPTRDKQGECVYRSSRSLTTSGLRNAVFL